MKIEGDTTCPNCKKEHPVEFDIDNLDIKKVEVPKARITNVESGQVQQLEEPKPQIIEKTKIPSYIPKFKCKNCKENHKNKDYHQRPKFKCTNCGQFSPSDDSCVWCDSKDFDEIDADELKDMGIEEPEEEEHDHEGE